MRRRAPSPAEAAASGGRLLEGQPALGDEPSDAIVTRGGARGDDVGDRTSTHRDPHLFAAFDCSQRLAQQALEVPHTDLAHVVRIAPMWSPAATTTLTTSMSRTSSTLSDMDVRTYAEGQPTGAVMYG